MGCTQSTPTVAPINSIPIERVFTIGNCAEIKPPPVIMIKAEPPPPYIKGVLKKNQVPKKTKPNIISMINSMPSPLEKIVNFDGQVLVRDRTPTPKKQWYEKASSTMPMRKHPRNDDDDDDDDYDDEEVPTISSDEEDENNTTITTLQQSTLPPQWNQPNIDWPYPDTNRGFMPITNKFIENEPFLPPMQQPTYSINEYRTESSTRPPTNSIKVRRNVSAFGPPQITSISPYASPVLSTKVFSNQSPLPVSSTFSPIQTTVPSPYLPPRQPLIHSTYPTNGSPLLQPSTFLSTNNALPEQRSAFNPNEKFLQTDYYGYSRQPIENRI